MLGVGIGHVLECVSERVALAIADQGRSQLSRVLSAERNGALCEDGHTPSSYPWKQSVDCGNIVSGFCQGAGLQPTWLFPVVFSQRQLEGLIPQARIFRATPAFGIGALIPRFDLFGIIKVDHEFPAGIIALENDFERQLADHERRFILAHEYSHIVMNHSPYALLGNLASSIVNNYLSGVQDPTARAVVGGVLSFLEVKISHTFSKQCELDADANAVLLTGDRQGAVETLRMLGNQFAGRLSAPSHWITKGRLRIPVVTYQERIDAL